MIGKQKVVIVVGALVIALLALFPPWVHHRTDFPAVAPGEVEIHETRGWGGFRWFAAGFKTADLEAEHAYPDHDAAITLQLAALALTAAAVILLKDRKPKA